MPSVLCVAASGYYRFLGTPWPWLQHSGFGLLHLFMPIFCLSQMSFCLSLRQILVFGKSGMTSSTSLYKSYTDLFSSKIAQVWNEGVGVSLGPSSFQPSESGPPWLIYAHRDTTRFTERTEMHTTGSLKIDAACQALSHVLGHHSFDTTEDTMTSTAARLLTFIDNPYSGLLRAHSLQRLIYLKICDLYPNLFLVSAKEFPKIKCRFCFSNTDQALCMC